MITPRTVIGARFMKAGRMYFFETGGVNDVELNGFVIVRTELGEDAARVAIGPQACRGGVRWCQGRAASNWAARRNRVGSAPQRPRK